TGFDEAAAAGRMDRLLSPAHSPRPADLHRPKAALRAVHFAGDLSAGRGRGEKVVWTARSASGIPAGASSSPINPLAEREDHVPPQVTLSRAPAIVKAAIHFSPQACHDPLRRRDFEEPGDEYPHRSV